jgi:hypothetical protein
VHLSARYEAKSASNRKAKNLTRCREGGKPRLGERFPCRLRMGSSSPACPDPKVPPTPDMEELRDSLPASRCEYLPSPTASGLTQSRQQGFLPRPVDPGEEKPRECWANNACRAESTLMQHRHIPHVIVSFQAGTQPRRKQPANREKKKKKKRGFSTKYSTRNTMHPTRERMHVHDCTTAHATHRFLLDLALRWLRILHLKQTHR